MRVDASTYSYDLWLLRPGVEQEVEVEAVVEMGDEFALYRRHSQGNPTETVTLQPEAAWLVDTDDETVVTIYQSDGRSSGFERQLVEVGEVFELPTGRVVQITDGVGLYRGRISGELHGREHQEAFLELRRRDKALRLIVGDMNIPARIRELRDPLANIPGNSVWDVEFEFFQVPGP